ncbi:AraC family transcriptional regulator [Aquimarina pacifica]|uniref:AraC family transcriptional regulator n=1 Tax=Aquimarina pacifica TaxID=1296415 RepID=UPI00126946AC|nr:AraC family transcriptional regulator [Aquimarina pacifica]
MKPSFRPVSYSFQSAFQIEKFDKKIPCTHDGLHFHNSYEIVFVKNGSGKINIEGIEFNYNNGTLIFMGPCIPHFGFSNTMFENNYEIVIHFDNVFVEQRLKLFPEFTYLLRLLHLSKRFLVFDTETKNKVAPMFENILGLTQGKQLLSIFGLLDELSLSTSKKVLIKEGVSDRYAQNKQVTKIFEFINKNYSLQVSTQDVAKHIGMTTNSFCRMFKTLTHKPFVEYLNEYRIHRGTKLLQETDDSISEIAYQCGFENHSYFSLQFCRVTGKTPINYRKEYRERIDVEYHKKTKRHPEK